MSTLEEPSLAGNGLPRGQGVIDCPVHFLKTGLESLSRMESATRRYDEVHRGPGSHASTAWPVLRGASEEVRILVMRGDVFVVDLQ